ncbi:hypothetical protein TgHK011_005144 [Trichoderma gracile]|nr:hypothetical protein TgHK011_005144 [Trichoderma gracile]
MSGFEIAGIILGAFPIAISALEAYRDLAERLGLLYKIRLECKKWHDDLELNKIIFTRNLRKLLLPLVVDDERIRELLSEPGGDRWKEESIAESLERRLQGSYQLYMQYIQYMKRTMDEINAKLAIDSEWAKRLLDESQASSKKSTLKGLISRERLALQVYKFKLSNSDSIRKRLFDELEEHNNKLEALLRSGDEDVRLMSDRRSRKRLENLDMSLCGFWKKAKSVFQALANAWICQCQQHGARLLLQHRTKGAAEFEILLTGFSPPRLGFHRIRVSEGGDMVAAALKENVTLIESMPPRQPSHKQSHPTKSALRTKNSRQGSLNVHRPMPSVTLTSINTIPPLSYTSQILNLCTAFQLPSMACYGFLADEDIRYYVHNISEPDFKATTFVTLDEILRGEICLAFTRMQRYTLSLILASTYLQLLDSPWLSVSLKRVDVIFHDATEEGASIRLDEPHISQHFTGADGVASAGKLSRFVALDRLGIMLLELCFGRTLESQQCRLAFGAGKNDMEKASYDILAARDWLCHVNAEAGPAYADAVSWCLIGNRCTPEEKWRQEMLRKVIEPLRLSCDFLANGGIEA